MKALIVIDVQNEFSKNGNRPVPAFDQAIEVIKKRVTHARQEGSPIAWVRHFNKPNESKAFVPGTWGSEFVDGFIPNEDSKMEKEFQKDVYGAFTGTNIGLWLSDLGADSVLIVGFYTHGCVSTTSREAIMRELNVWLDPDATGTCDLNDVALGHMPASEVKRSALLQLINMGAQIERL